MDTGLLDEEQSLGPKVLFDLTFGPLGFYSRPESLPSSLCVFLGCSMLLTCSLFHGKCCGAITIFVG